MSEQGIAWFNALSPEEAQAKLYACFADRDWAARVAALRPLRDVDALVAVGDGEMPSIVEEIWEEIIESHPRIGERGGHSPSMSEREQSGVLNAPPEALAALAAENRAYEAKFGWAFIISATGHSTEEILQALRRRMSNNPLVELAIVVEEIHDITEVRLRALVNR